jgi:hypothetical protein
MESSRLATPPAEWKQSPTTESGESDRRQATGEVETIDWDGMDCRIYKVTAGTNEA